MNTKKETLLETATAKIGSQKFKTSIASGGHIIIGDESIEEGGSDLGMNPFSLLLAALSSCSASSVKLFAERRQWPLNGATVNVVMKKVEQNGAAFTEITKELWLDGYLTAEQKEKLLDVAAHCPVHTILTGYVSINTVMGEQEAAMENHVG